MAVWEYKIHVSDLDDETDEETLNSFGTEGWELVNAIADMRPADDETLAEDEIDDEGTNVPVTVFYFKRQKGF